MRPAPQVGFYGKLPSHGDFLRRRASETFVRAWDAWLQECIAASRSALGDRWLDVYLTSPAWRFACAHGICGPAAVAGVMAPSVDRVGRYFPLTVVAELPLGVTATAASAASPFFESAERLIIETLEADEVNFDRFDDRVIALAGYFEAVRAPGRAGLDAAAAAILGNAAPEAAQIAIDSPAQPAGLLEQLAGYRLAALYDPVALWWTEGSSIIDATLLVSRGLPSPERYVAMLDGQWGRRRWHSPGAAGDTRPAAADAVVDAAPLRFASAAASDTGRVREKNQDSYLDRPEAGVWAVADGLGGHRDGEVASRMVCDALADWDPDTNFDGTIEDARRRIDEVNRHLLRIASRSLHAERIATTIVALLTRGAECAVIWAGDSRAYRWRGGQLEQLTRDHSLVEAGASSHDPASNIVTRALGAGPDVVLDVSRFGVRPGDRFLLCSDGLTRTVPDAQIGLSMAGPDIRGTVDQLIRLALAAGAPDNVTALVVEAGE
jgi:type VI secretion system protein ImpM